MKVLIQTLLLVLLSISPLFSESLIDLMGRIKSVRTLLVQRLPKEYTVPVVIGGDVGESIIASIDSLGLVSPRYYESYRRDEGFSLLVDSKNMPPYTNEMISGVLNPVEMNNIILNTFTSYRKYASMKSLLKETKVKRSKIEYQGEDLLVMEFTPRGDRFKYVSRDNGPVIRESWLDSMAIKIKGAMEIKELFLIKNTVLHYENKREESKVKQRYVFEYKDMGKTLLPVDMKMFNAERLCLRISAEYKYRDDMVLFKKRDIVFFDKDGKENRLVIEYGKYRFDYNTGENTSELEKGFSEEMIEAAEIVARAEKALNSGDMDRAYLLYRKLLRRYPDTPQALEAKQLLRGL